MTSTLMVCMLAINTALTHIQPCVFPFGATRVVCTHTHTHTQQRWGVRGGDDEVAIETVLFQVWSVRMIKSSNEVSHLTYLMPFELYECKPVYKHCKQKPPHLVAI